MNCDNWPPLKETNIPSYVQIYDIIFQMIQNASLKDGDSLPGENLLAAHWNVSRSTVRTAVRRLEEDGYLHRTQGKRTMVATRMSHLDNGLQWLFNPCLKNCISPVTAVHVAPSLQQCGKYVAEKLGCAMETSVMGRIEAQYYVMDRQVAFSLLMFHSSMLEKWNIMLQDEAQMKELVSRQIYQYAVRSGIELTAMRVDEEVDEIPGSRNLVIMEEVIIGEQEEPIAYFKYWMNANWYRFAVDRKPMQLC